jgi:hypothetical protein
MGSPACRLERVIGRGGDKKGTRTLSPLRITKTLSIATRASLDIFWLRDESLEESDNLPDVRSKKDQIALVTRRYRFQWLCTFSLILPRKAGVLDRL